MAKKKRKKKNLPVQGPRVGDVDHGATCIVCGASPVVVGTDLCGPCCFGESDTAGGNW